MVASIRKRLPVPIPRLGALLLMALMVAPGTTLLAGPAEGKSATPPAPKGAPSPSTAKRDWSDLQDNEFKLFGSDKEEKIPLGLKPIAEIEDWRDPQTKERYLSYKFAWLFYWTINVNRYPNFDRTRFLLYSNLESKIDNRRQTWFLPLYYFERDGDEETTLTPLTYHFFSNREEIGLIGPFYNYRTRDETRRFLLPLVYYGDNRAENSSYLGVFPLFLHSSRRDETETNTTLLTPLFYHTSRSPAGGDSSAFSVSPLHFFNRQKDQMTFGLPAIPLLFFRHENREDVHYNMALIFDALWKKDTLERLWAFPLLFYQRGEQGYLHVAPPLYISFQEPGFSYTHMLPLYFHLVRERREIEATPIYFYTHEDDAQGVRSTHQNLFWLLDWATDTKQGLRRFAFIPFFFYSPGPEKYLHILPPLYVSFGEQNWSYRHLLPFAFQWKDGQEEIEFYWLYTHATDGHTDHYNYLGFVDLGFDRAKGFNRLWTVPFLFYQPDSYLHIVPPLYVSLTWADSGYRHVFPFYFNAWNNEGSFLFAWLYTRITDPDSTFYNVAGLFNATTDRKDHLTRVWVLPFYYGGPNYRHIAPLYFSWEDNATKNMFGPGYYYSREKGPAAATSLLAGPLWVHRKPAEERTDVHLLPVSYLWLSKNEFTWFVLPALSYISFQHSERYDESRMYWPLWFYARDIMRSPEKAITDSMTLFAWLYYGERYSHRSGDGGDAFSGLDVSPLYVYRRSHARTPQRSTRSYSAWFPVLPLFFRSYSTEEGTHTNALYLADWKSDAEGKLERFWFFPFAFYGRDDYLHVFPFFVRPSGANVKEGWSAGLIHFHSWSEAHDRLWLGLYYGANDRSDKSATTVLFPFYYDWQRDDSKGNLLLPFRIRYEDRQKLVSIWFFGGSSSQQAGSLTANVGKSTRGLWYVDVDYSFLYNLFSFSARRSIFAPSGQEKQPTTTVGKTGGTAIAKGEPPGEGVSVVGGSPALRYFDKVKLDEEAEARRRVERDQPKLTKKPEISRETARDFWGATVLFGLFAYERADTETHLRIFPLMWLTWDDSYNDRVTALPFFFHYERGAECSPSDTECQRLSYTVLFPFYGFQRVNQSHISAYGLFLYLNEYDDEIKETSHSILWPFLQKYDSPTRDGFRVFPLVWHRNTHEREVDEKGRSVGALKRKGHTTVVAPILYHTSESVRTPQGWEHSAFRINPLEFYRQRTDSDGESELAWRPLIPLYVTRTTGLVTGEASSPTLEVARSGWSLFLPVALTHSLQVVRKNKQTDGETILASEFSLYGLPFLYYGVSQAATPETRSRSFFLLGYYDHEHEGYSQQSFLFGLFSRARAKEPFESSLSFLYGLIRSEDHAGGSTAWLLPFYYGATDQLPGGHARITAAPILLTWYSETSTRLEGKTFRETAFVSPLYMHWEKRDTAGGIDESSTLFPLLPLPLLYRSTVNGRDEWDWLKIFHWERKPGENLSWRFFPLLFYDSADEGSFTVFPIFWTYTNPALKERAVHVIPPLFMSWTRPNEWSMFVAGLYLQSGPESSRQNFLYLVDHRTDKLRNEYVFGMLFDFFRIRGGSKRRFDLDVGFGLLFGLNAEGSERYDWNFLWMQNEKRPGRFESSFIPFWWFESRTHQETRRGERVIGAAGTEWSLWLLPLTYISVDTRPDRGDTYFLLGGMYFRSEKDYSRQNLYFLYDHYSHRSRQEEYWGLLFHAFSYEKQQDRTKVAALYRILGGVDYRNPTDYDFNVLWYVQYQTGTQFNSVFLPLWYYTSDPNGSVLIVPPLLAYSSRDRGGLFQLVGLGAVWYRNYDAATLEDSRRVLLGAAYEEQTRAANGFHSVGSAWGFLWQYQSESETGFRKFSVLRVPFYRKVRRDGELRTYILGIPTD